MSPITSLPSLRSLSVNLTVGIRLKTEGFKTSNGPSPNRAATLEFVSIKAAVWDGYVNKHGRWGQ